MNIIVFKLFRLYNIPETFFLVFFIPNRWSNVNVDEKLTRKSLKCIG